jgi:hypothetical protein
LGIYSDEDLYEHDLLVQNNPYADKNLYQTYNDNGCDKNLARCQILDMLPKNDAGGMDHNNDDRATYHHNSVQKMDKNVDRDCMYDIRRYLSCNNLVYIRHTLVRKGNDGDNDHKGWY